MAVLLLAALLALCLLGVALGPGAAAAATASDGSCPSPMRVLSVSDQALHIINSTSTTLLSTTSRCGVARAEPYITQALFLRVLSTGEYAIKIRHPLGGVALNLEIRAGECNNGAYITCSSLVGAATTAGAGWDSIHLVGPEIYTLFISSANLTSSSSSFLGYPSGNVLSLSLACPAEGALIVVSAKLEKQSVIFSGINAASSMTLGRTSCGKDRSTEVPLSVGSFTPSTTGVYSFSYLAQLPTDVLELRQGTCFAFEPEDIVFCSSGGSRLGGNVVLTAGQEYSIILGNRRASTASVTVRYVGPQADNCPSAMQHVLTPSWPLQLQALLNITTTLQCSNDGYTTAAVEMRYASFMPPVTGVYSIAPTTNAGTGQSPTTTTTTLAMELRAGTCSGEPLACVIIPNVDAGRLPRTLGLSELYLSANKPYMILVGRIPVSNNNNNAVTLQPPTSTDPISVEVRLTAENAWWTNSSFSTCSDHDTLSSLPNPQEFVVDLSAATTTATTPIKSTMTSISCSTSPSELRQAVYATFTPKESGNYYMTLTMLAAAFAQSEQVMEVRREHCTDNIPAVVVACGNQLIVNTGTGAAASQLTIGFDSIALLKDVRYVILMSSYQVQALLPYWSPGSSSSTAKLSVGWTAGAGGQDGKCIDNALVSTTQAQTIKMTRYTTVDTRLGCTDVNTDYQARFASFAPPYSGDYAFSFATPSTNERFSDVVLVVRDKPCGESGSISYCLSGSPLESLGLTSITLKKGMTYIFLLAVKSSPDVKLPFDDVVFKMEFIGATTKSPTQSKEDDKYWQSTFGAPKAQALAMLILPGVVSALALVWAYVALRRTGFNAEDEQLTYTTPPPAPCWYFPPGITACLHAVTRNTASLSKIRRFTIISRVLVVVVFATCWAVFVLASAGYLFSAVIGLGSVRLYKAATTASNFRASWFYRPRRRSSWTLLNMIPNRSGVIRVIGVYTIGIGVLALFLSVIDLVCVVNSCPFSRSHISMHIYGLICGVALLALGGCVIVLGRSVQNVSDMLHLHAPQDQSIPMAEIVRNTPSTATPSTAPPPSPPFAATYDGINSNDQTPHNVGGAESCAVCSNGKITRTFYRCGHRCCTNCAKKIMMVNAATGAPRCPLCRQRIEDIIVFY